MCSPNDPPASAIVAEARSDKERSRTNPDGVTYLDHVWEMIKDIDKPLKVVLRTEYEVFDDVPVRAFWRRYQYSHDVADDIWRYDLMFDLPDEVVRRVQSRIAGGVMYRHFGVSAGELPRPFREEHSMDDKRLPRWGVGELTVIKNDWPLLKEAIKATSEYGGSGQLGGANAYVWPDRFYSVLVRVQDATLELKLADHAMQRLERPWLNAVQKRLQLKDSRW